MTFDINLKKKNQTHSQTLLSWQLFQAIISWPFESISTYNNRLSLKVDSSNTQNLVIRRNKRNGESWFYNDNNTSAATENRK